MTKRGEMPFLDHLEELRWRILWSLLAILVCTVVGWWLLGKVDIIDVLKRPVAPYLPGGRLIFTSPAEPFMLTLKVAFALGCLLASPIVIYQIWAFLAPALYEREKRLIIPALAVGVVLFLAGAVACYEWLLPAALKVLLGFQRSDLTAMITIDRYFGMAVPFVVGCGLIAELPLVVTILASLGIITPQFLGRQRRYAIVIAAFLAAILTPPDAVSMMLMLGPLLLLYELSIWCAWIASRRRARRMAAATLIAIVLGMGWAGPVHAQNPPPPPPPPPPAARPVVRDTSARRDSTARPPGVSARDTTRGQAVDTATARKLGLPTAPSRSFPPPDPIIDSLLKLPNFRTTRYVADTLVVQGDSQTILLRHEAYVERESTQLQADSIRYHEASCQLHASGNPQLFDQGTVLIGEGMWYDTCVRRGTVRDALTDFQQGGVTWYMHSSGAAIDSGSTRVYARSANFTSDPQPVPDYHFAAGQVKWINKSTMIARPVVLYVRDVPIMWLPFIFNDIRGGRRSGILFPRFGLNDLVRPTRHYARHITDLGYYFALNDYVDVLFTGDWFAGRYVQFHGQAQYHWLDRFMDGQLTYSRMSQIDFPGVNSRIGWNHTQRFNARTSFNAHVDYSTNGSLIQKNSLNPWEVKSTIASNLNFAKQFSWGALNIGGSRSQDLSNNNISQTVPTINLTPAAVNITPWMTWSPGFTYQNQQQFHVASGTLLVPGRDTIPVDTLHLFQDNRQTTMSINTPLRIGRWNWANSISVSDVRANARKEFTLPGDSTAVRRVLFGETFETQVDWQTSINLPSFFPSTWKLQPSIGIQNKVGGPFMIRNQFTGGEFVRQGKRPSFNVSISPTFFGFFPGFGPLARIRHAISPQISYQYAPGDSVSDAFAHAIDPSGISNRSHTDPQQTISFGLSQNFEAKLKPPPGDTSSTAEPRKIKLLSINTSGIGYNLEQAKQPHHTGWQTGTISNTFLSDLVPGFQLQITHDLWKGQVGTDSAKFSPFLQNLSASFTVTPATLQGVGRLLGLRAKPAPPPPADTTGQLGARSDDFRRYDGSTRSPYAPRGLGLGLGGGLGGGGGGRGFTLSIAFSSTRSRSDTTPQQRHVPGRQTTTMNLSFSPTRNWSATWNTSYDFATRQFADHSLTFQRDLRRWRAVFGFHKTATGSFSFTFNITLTDQPAIKFDYDQNTYPR